MKNLLMFFICLSCSAVWAQPAKDTLRIVDMHVHPTMKNYLEWVAHPKQLQDPVFLKNLDRLNWDTITAPGKKRFSSATGFEQATYGVLYDLFNDTGDAYTRASILCASITPIEKKFVSNERIIGISLRRINSLAVTRLKMERLRTLADSDNTSYDEFRAEYQFLINHSQDTAKNSQPYSIVPVRNNAHLREILSQHKTAIILTVEGGHVLLSKHSLKDHIHKGDFPEGDFRAYISDDSLEVEKAPDGTDIDKLEIDGIYAHIDSLKKLEYRIFFITLAHMAWNKIVGHAKSLDMKGYKRNLITAITASKMAGPKILNKHAEGFFDKVKDNNHKDRRVVSSIGIGKEVAIRLLDSTDNVHNKRIFIDVKHMDIRARFDYYTMLDSLKNSEGKFKGRNIPIIASHVAVSGKDSSEAVFYGLFNHYDRYKEVNRASKARRLYRKYRNEKEENFPSADEILKKTEYFYPWSINLCNQEIKYIYRSNGMIGVTLESRVIGEERPGYRNTSNKKKLREALSRQFNIEGKDLENVFKEYRGVEPLLRNMFHIVKYSGRNDATAWNHISLGSDYDGVMAPLSAAKRMTDLRTLFSTMIKYMTFFAANNNQTGLLYDRSPRDLMEKIFYRNGEEFILKHF